MPSLSASFQFDDYRVITGDARVRSIDAWWHALPAIRPLLRLSYALGHELGGSPAVFRAFNIALHATATVLVLFVLRQFGARCALPPASAEPAAWIGAAIFALHPIATESVTYISGRSSSLAALGVLAATAAWLRAEQATRPNRWYTLAMLCGILALAAKETAVLLPLAFAAFVAIGPAQNETNRRAALRALALLTLLLCLCGVLLLLTTPYDAILVDALQRRPPLEHLLSQGRGTAALVGHFLLPWTVTVELDLRPATPRDWDAIAASAALLLSPLIAFALRKRAPAIALGLWWIIVWLLPTHSLFARQDIANDRQFYLPLVTAAWLVGLALARLQRGRVAVTAALLLGLGCATLLQNRVYRDERSYWEAAVAAAPNNARAANNLGYAYALTCRDAAALRAFRVALQLDPANVQARANLALLARGALFLQAERRCESDRGAANAP